MIPSMIRFSSAARAALACGVAVVLVGCSGTQAPAAQAPTPAPATPAPATPAPATPATAPTAAGVPRVAADEAGVRTIFNASYAALTKRDFDTACALNAPETNAVLLKTVAAKGLQASTCPEALTGIYAVPGASAVVDEIVRSAMIDSVTVNGANATITWSATAQGQRRTVTSAMRLVDGQWRLVDTGSR